MISVFTSSIFHAILLGLIAVLAIARVCIPLALRLRLVDLPGREPHKQHLRPVPMAGGIALLLSLLLGEWLFGTLDFPAVRGSYLAVLVIFIFGLLDDYKNLSPIYKLIGQILAAVVLVRLGVSIGIFESPGFFIQVEPPFDRFIDWGLTILWVVGITNAFNFVDSMDGLAVGLGGVAAAFFMIVTLDAQQPDLAIHSALILGVCAGLYFFNSPPALLFLGDSGAQTLGFLLAVLSIAYNPQGAEQSSSWFIPILLLGVPIFDLALVVFSRMRRGKPIYTAARDHTYHRLLSLGLDPFRAVVVMHMAALSLGCFAFVILTQPPLFANLAFAFALLLGVILVVLFDWRKSWL